MGARLTCTSSGDRKIATRTAGPTNGSTASSIDITRPSAGASTPLATAGIVPLGIAEEPGEARRRRRERQGQPPPAEQREPQRDGAGNRR